MEIKNLANTHLSTIVVCLVKSFENYFVKMPDSVEFWKKRFQAARVDYSLSFGAFDGDKLIGFVIHGIDTHHDALTAFNTGTGVVEGYRGQKVVDQLYEAAIPQLRARGVSKCMLEVIDENHIAVRVYERIGFAKDRHLLCFKAEEAEVASNPFMSVTNLEDLHAQMTDYQHHYSWDHSIDAISTDSSRFDFYLVQNEKGNDIGYFIINPNNKSLTQVEAFDNTHWPTILNACKAQLSPIRINNADSKRGDMIDAFKNAGLENHISQFEMTMMI